MFSRRLIWTHASISTHSAGPKLKLYIVSETSNSWSDLRVGQGYLRERERDVRTRESGRDRNPGINSKSRQVARDQEKSRMENTEGKTWKKKHTNMEVKWGESKKEKKERESMCKNLLDRVQEYREMKVEAKTNGATDGEINVLASCRFWSL